MINLLQSLVSLELDSFAQLPLSTYAIMGITATITLVTSLWRKRTTNIEEFKRKKIASSHAQQEVMAAMRSGNQRRIEKAQKRQQEASQEQMKMLNAQMKNNLLILLPLLLIYPALNTFFGSEIVAVMPFSFPYLGQELTYFNWYLLNSFFTKTIFDRILGLEFEIEPAKISE